MNQLKINSWGKTIGYLAWDESINQSVLELDDEYINSNFNLSPLLIDKSIRIHYSGNEEAFYGLHPLFADSLPDYFGNRVFQEWLTQKKYATTDLNPVDRLLYIGKRGVGALEYEPDKTVAKRISKVDFDELAAISKKITENKYDYQDFMENKQALTNILNIGSSVGGAQAKVLVAINDSTGEIKAGDVLHKNKNFQYYIVKLAYESGTPWGKEKTYIEHVYNHIAKKAGLNVMPCELIVTQNGAHFKTLRYDRKDGEKIHVQTLKAITGYADKRIPFSYEEAFMVLERLGVNHSDKLNLYKQMIFNVATANMDDHTKNFSFMMSKDGEWSLAPAYDLTYPFDPYQHNLKFHKMTINGKTKSISREDLLAVGKRVGIRNAKSYIDDVVSSVQEFKKLASTFPISNKTVTILGDEITHLLQQLK